MTVIFLQLTLAVPTEVDSYHSLFPLEPLPPPNRIQKSSNFGYITSCYKAVNSKDDLPYCLRRIHGKESAFPQKHVTLLRLFIFSYKQCCIIIVHVSRARFLFYFSSFVLIWRLILYSQHRPFLKIQISLELSFTVDCSREFSSLGFRLVNTKCMVLVDMWKKIQHSNIVTLREVFTTKAFAEPCK